MTENENYKDMYFDLLADDITICNRYIKLLHLTNFLGEKLDAGSLTPGEFQEYSELMNDWRSEVVIHNDKVRRYLENANGTEGNT